MLVLDEFDTWRTILEKEMLVLLRSSDVTGGCDRKATVDVGERDIRRQYESSCTLRWGPLDSAIRGSALAMGVKL